MFSKASFDSKEKIVLSSSSCPAVIVKAKLSQFFP